MKQPNDLNPYQSPESSSRIAAGFGKPTTDNIIVLASFCSLCEAYLLRNELVNSGVVARVANQETGATATGTVELSLIEVLVLESQADRALVIKKQWKNISFSNSAGEIAEWICECGETVDAGFAVCWNCEAEHGRETAN